MISATSGINNEVYEHYHIQDNDLAIIINGEKEKVLVYWPENKETTGLDLLRLYSILIRFELQLRDTLKEISVTLTDEDLDFFRTKIIDEAYNLFNTHIPFDKDKIH